MLSVRCWPHKKVWQCRSWQGEKWRYHIWYLLKSLPSHNHRSKRVGSLTRGGTSIEGGVGEWEVMKEKWLGSIWPFCSPIFYPCIFISLLLLFHKPFSIHVERLFNFFFKYIIFFFAFEYCHKFFSNLFKSYV